MEKLGQRAIRKLWAEPLGAGKRSHLAMAVASITSAIRPRYLTFSQTSTPTPSRPSTGLLLGAVFIVKVSPCNL